MLCLWNSCIIYEVIYRRSRYLRTFFLLFIFYKKGPKKIFITINLFFNDPYKYIQCVFNNMNVH